MDKNTTPLMSNLIISKRDLLQSEWTGELKTSEPGNFLSMMSHIHAEYFLLQQRKSHN